MGVRVEVYYNCPLGSPGVVLVREETVWQILVDVDTPPGAAALAIEFLTALAEMPELADVAEEPESEEDGGAMTLSRPPLPPRRRREWVRAPAEGLTAILACRSTCDAYS